MHVFLYYLLNILSKYDISFLKCEFSACKITSELSPALGALMDLLRVSLDGGASFRARRTRRWWDNDAAQQDRRVTAEGISKSSRRTISSSFFRPPKPDHDLRACVPSREFVSLYLGAAYTCSLTHPISIFFLRIYICIYACAIVYTYGCINWSPGERRARVSVNGRDLSFPSRWEKVSLNKVGTR